MCTMSTYRYINETDVCFDRMDSGMVFLESGLYEIVLMVEEASTEQAEGMLTTSSLQG